MKENPTDVFTKSLPRSSLLKSNSLLERAAWWLMVKLASSPIRSQGGECCTLASN